MNLNKSIIEKLEDRGIRLNAIVDSALKLYEPYGEVDLDKDIKEIEHRLTEIIRNKCEDINVKLLIEAALHLDDEMSRYGLELKDDPVNVICDELIGISIAEYIGGKKALFNFVRYDMKKPGILAELGIFLDDAVGGLIAGCMTRLFEDWR